MKLQLKFNFSWRISLICLVLMCGMVRASFWQWDRHLEKKAYIAHLSERLALPAEKITNSLEADTDWQDLTYRQFEISGEYDFSEEIVIANRRYQDSPGKHVITPLRIDGTDRYILISRGFVPLSHSNQETRKMFQKPKKDKFVALVKPSLSRSFFLQPKDPDPTPDGHEDLWLRVDIPKISIQTPYSLLPVYAEITEQISSSNAAEKLVKASSDKADILVLPGAESKVATPGLKDLNYPVPDPDKVIPPGRHLGYVYEWAFMAAMTFLIGLVLQLKRH